MKVPERLLLGPGPSPVSPRVMQALGSPIVSHLDPAMMALLDDLRARLGWAFGAESSAFSFAVSGTGTSGMEAAIANVTAPGARALVVVDRVLRRSAGADPGAIRRRGFAAWTVEWGRACDPDAGRARARSAAAPTSSRWCTAKRRPVS